MKYLFTTFLFVFCFSTLSKAQLHTSDLHQGQISLKIGDKLPEVIITNFLDRQHPGTALSDLYKNGGLIINFWATWCAPCIKELPVLNALAGKYHDKLNVLSVEYENESTVVKFLKEHPDLKLGNIKMLVGDTLFVEYLKHRGLPFNVWIDNKGIIRHFTDSEDISEANVVDFLENKKDNVHEVKEILNWDFNQPFHLKDSAYQYRSIFTGNTDGILSGFTYYAIQKPKERLINRIFVFNQTISLLYKIAYLKMATSASMSDYDNMIEFQVKDSTKFFSPKSNSLFLKKSKYKTTYDWQRENCYCYELTLPELVKDSVAFDYMFDDLQRRFHLNVNIENKQRLCTVISLAKGVKRFLPSTKDSSFYKITPEGIQAEHIILTTLFENLNIKIRPTLQTLPLDPHYINETGINYPIDLKLEFVNKNPTYQEIKNLLKHKYGFEFKSKKRFYPVLIIKEK